MEIPSRELIIQKRGSYAWGTDLNTVVDTDVFEDLIKQASAPEIEEQQRIQLLLEAIQLYQGDFLPQSGGEFWVIPISAYYHTLYIDMIHQTTELLFEEESYPAIIDICQKALALEPFDDSIYICVLTITDTNSQAPRTALLNKAMTALEDAIRSSLWRGDVFCRYSISQYLILLPTATYENGCIALRRIINNFYNQYHNRTILVSYSLQALLPG